MGSDPREVVRRFWEDVWTKGDADALSEIFDPDAVENGLPVDVEQFQRAVIWWRKVFPDFSATVEELIPIGEDRVVSRVTYRGTQALAWFGLPATGRSFEVLGIDIFRTRDGRIIDFWHSTDHLVVAEQIGGTLAPKPPAS